MIIGCVKEIKNNEYRVGLTPQAVREYCRAGHQVIIQSGCGVGSSFSDDDYQDAGARVLESPQAVWKQSQMIVKVKEPIASEYQYLRPGLILYTYLHLAADENLTAALLKNKVIAVAYETIVDSDGSLPCLKPMSQVAGRLAVLEGAKYLLKPYGGIGLLIGGVPGVQKANCLVLGAGVVGENATGYLVGLDAKVTVLDINNNRLEYLEHLYHNKITTLYNNEQNLIQALKEADLIISSVLLPGSKAPKLIKKAYYPFMKKGSVIVDVAIDQGGTTEVSRPTTHQDPVFTYEGIIHYCVANMPGAVSLTATQALNNATLKYGLLIAASGLKSPSKACSALKKGLNTYLGQLTNQAVAEALNLAWVEVDELPSDN
ncbi:MAG: alanine dehydrogenase [Acholeplasmatales bacterium]|jgi:alanine dehydrogenase|nr:alanine dehydrogenase [Acholeplasmatales bacterium]